MVAKLPAGHHDDKNYLNSILNDIRSFLDEHLRLKLKEKVVRIAPVTEGVPFLGFRIFPNLIRLQRPNLIRLRKKVKKREFQFSRGLISEKELAKSVNSIVAHIAHADSTMMRRREFEASLSLA